MEAQQGGGPTHTMLLEAMQAMYHHPDPSIRNVANQWLDEFQHIVEAWQVLEAN
jgi:transportin-3